MAIQGSCLCGTLRYEFTGPLTSMIHCHCSRCRKAHGAPFATFAAAGLDDLHWLAGEADVVTYAPTETSPRPFCRHCGSPAPGRLPAMGISFVPVGTLDADPGLKPQAHMFTGSKAPWYTITDALPQYERFPPDWGDLPAFPDAAPVQVAPGRSAGSCLCGEVAWEFGKPVAMFQCHCGRCRKARGAAHGANLFCRIEDFEWRRGAGLVTSFKLPAARFFTVAFCRQCGGSVPQVSEPRGIVVIPASALDTDPLIRPMAHIFVASKAPWFEITDSLQQVPEYPPGFTPPPPRE